VCIGLNLNAIPKKSKTIPNLIKYNKYNFIWETHESIKKPFLEFEDKDMNIKIPIFNLHIHSKNLLKFM
jgi:hypothetical protein